VAVEDTALTPLTSEFELAAVVVEVAPEACCEVLLLVLAVSVDVVPVATGVAAAKPLCAWLELSEVVAADTVAVNSKPEHAIAKTRAATDLKLINMYSPKEFYLE